MSDSVSTIFNKNISALLGMCCILLQATVLNAQKPDARDLLFDSDEVLEFQLMGPVKNLFANRVGEALDFEFTLSRQQPDGTNIQIPLQVKTRGHFRRLPGNCEYPPLMLTFNGDGEPEHSIFKGQHELKLVMPCRGDKYVVREFIAYKIFNLITPLSFKARLVKVSFFDTKAQSASSPVYGIILEDEDQMALRNGGEIVKKDSLRPKQIDPDNFFDMAIFQYLIGNTDWSIQYRQNIKLVLVEGENLPKAVPYDFDHSGLVMAPYAHPPAELNMSSVRQRRFRGYCLFDVNLYDDRLQIFRAKHADFVRVVSECVYLDQKSKKLIHKYLDQFQDIITNSKKWQYAFEYPCDEKGTGNVVIKGLRN